MLNKRLPSVTTLLQAIEKIDHNEFPKLYSDRKALNTYFCKLLGTNPEYVTNYCVYYTDSTPRLIDTNTGVQRVVRNVGFELENRGDLDLFCVGWNLSGNELVLLGEELALELSKFGGPSNKACRVATQLAAKYNLDVPRIISQVIFNNAQSFICAEVLWVSAGRKQPHAELISLLKRYPNLTSLAIHYDDIPLYSAEWAAYSVCHKKYLSTIALFDNIVSISKYSANTLMKSLSDIGFYPLTAKCHTAWLPHEILHISRGTHSGKAQSCSSLRILCVGSITKHKNQLTLMRAFKELKTEDHPSFKSAIIIFIGNIVPSLEKEVLKLLDSDSNMSLVRGCSDKQLLLEYKQCDFTCFPSLLEGYGLPIGESLWLGKPVLASDSNTVGALSGDIPIPGVIRCDTSTVVGMKNGLITIANECLNTKKEIYTKLANSSLRTWSDYVDDIEVILNNQTDRAHDSCRQKRILWIGHHKILIHTEYKWLRSLGYECFRPSYKYTEIYDQSAIVDEGCIESLTIPEPDIKRLKEINFFYSNLSLNEAALINKYFSTVIVTCSPAWLNSLAKSFTGKIVFRTYGQPFSISNQESILDVKQQIVAIGRRFCFMPFHASSSELEDNWLTRYSKVVPYSLNEDIYNHMNSWRPDCAKKYIGVSIPNLQDRYYRDHYNSFKKSYCNDYFKIFGVQPSTTSKLLSDDSRIVGTIDRSKLLSYFQQISGYLYIYHSPSVCYVPPIEAIIIGCPVLYPKGSLLHRLICEMNGISNLDPSLPGCFSSTEESIEQIKRLRYPDNAFVAEIKHSQQKVSNYYSSVQAYNSFCEAIRNIAG